MKTIVFILIGGFLALLISCGQRGGNDESVVIVSDTLQNSAIQKKQRIGEQNTDSINLEKILNKAILAADKYKNQNIFEEKFVETMPDSSYQVEVKMRSDYFFTNKKEHLIIKRNTPGYVYIDIFLKENNKFRKVLSHEEWNMTYVSDTIRDINGDGLKDFVVNWYGSSGCCLKAFSNVYLLKGDNTFLGDYEFINPTFDPKEKIIRGVCYGHPGETEMYKYKWRGENVDTLEYVSYQKNDKGAKTGKIIISPHRPYDDKYEVLRILNSVPSEYHKIDGYDWFTGEGYN